MLPAFPRPSFSRCARPLGKLIVVSRDREGGRRFAERHLAGLDDPVSAECWTRMVRDYALFNRDYDLRNSVCNV